MNREVRPVHAPPSSTKRATINLAPTHPAVITGVRRPGGATGNRGDGEATPQLGHALEFNPWMGLEREQMWRVWMRRPSPPWHHPNPPPRHPGRLKSIVGRHTQGLTWRVTLPLS
jgi:hypothetical protein